MRDRAADDSMEEVTPDENTILTEKDRFTMNQ